MKKYIEILNLVFWIVAITVMIVIGVTKIHDQSINERLIEALDENTEAYVNLNKTIENL